MSFGESKYPFGDQNPLKPLSGLGEALGKVMDAHRDRKNSQIEAEGKAAGAALQTHLNLEAGMIDREHMVHVFGTQLKPHLKEGTNVTFNSGNHGISGTWAGGDAPADGESNGEAKPTTPKKPAAARKPRGPQIRTIFDDKKGKVTGYSVAGHHDTFPTPVNVQPSAGGKKPAATPTTGGTKKPAGGGRKPAGSATGGTKKPASSTTKPGAVAKPKTAAQLAQKPAAAKRPQPKK